MEGGQAVSVDPVSFWINILSSPATSADLAPFDFFHEEDLNIGAHNHHSGDIED